MVTINLKTKGLILNPKGTMPTVLKGQVNTVQIVVELDSDVWREEYNLFAIFLKGDDKYDIPLVNYSCLIPWELMSEAGTFEVCIHGSFINPTMTEGGTSLSSPVEIEVLDTMSLEGVQEISDPTPTVYSQIQEALGGYLEDVDALNGEVI